MHRQTLLHLLNAHSPFDETEAAMLKRLRDFVLQNENCFERTLLSGHITGSAWVSNKTGTQVLLLHHAKLHRWLQPGGHCDGDSDVLRVALREAQEESGLTSLRTVSSDIFDVDVHWIPERGANQAFVPGHWHYDVRFLLRANANEPLQINHEAKAWRWVDVTELQDHEDESLRRMALKCPFHLRI